MRLPTATQKTSARGDHLGKRNSHQQVSSSNC